MESKRADQINVGDRIWHGSTIKSVRFVKGDGSKDSPLSFCFGDGKYEWAGWFRADEQIPLAQ